MIETVVIVAVVSAGAAAIRYLAKKGDAAGEEAWRSAAHRVGGEVVIGPAPWFGIGTREIALTTHEGVVLRASAVERGSRNSRVIVTVLRSSRLPAGVGTRITCERRDLVHRVSRKLGIGERPTGDERFDEEVHLARAEPASLALALLDGRTRLAVQNGDAGFDLDDGVLVIETEGEPREAEPLVAMVRLAEALVTRWTALASAPERLATRLGLAAEPLRSLERGAHRAGAGMLAGHVARLAVRVEEELLLTVLTLDAHVGASIEAEWTLEPRTDGALETTGGRPTQAILAYASVAPVCLLGLRAVPGTGDAPARLELAFDGLELDAEVVRTAAEAVASATSAASPYR